MKKEQIIILGAILLLAGIGGGAALYMGTRGFRNNNPGNLKYGTPWVGVVGQDAGGFAVFDSMVNGVRALGKDLTAKMGRGLDTVREIVSVYAPPSENPTATYVQKVAGWMGVGPDYPLTSRDLPALMDAMIRFENGKTIDRQTLYAGIQAMA